MSASSAAPGSNPNQGKEGGGFWDRGWKLLALFLTAALAASGAWLGAQTQFSHESETNRDRARAVARLMIADFDGAALNLCDVGTRGSWFVSFVPLRSQVSPADRQLLAREMKDDLHGWQTVEAADNRLVTWDAVQRGVVGEYVDPIDWGFKRILKKAMAARRALEPMAGYHSEADRSFRQACPQSRKWHRARFNCFVPSGLPPGKDAEFPSCTEQLRSFRKRHPGTRGRPLP